MGDICAFVLGPSPQAAMLFFNIWAVSVLLQGLFETSVLHLLCLFQALQPVFICQSSLLPIKGSGQRSGQRKGQRRSQRCAGQRSG